MEDITKRIITTNTRKEETRKDNLSVKFYEADKTLNVDMKTSINTHNVTFSVIELPKTKIYEEDIPLMVASILALVNLQQDVAVDIHDKLIEVCEDFIKNSDKKNENEESQKVTPWTVSTDDSSHGLIVGKDGRLKDDIIDTFRYNMKKEDEQ